MAHFTPSRAAVNTQRSLHTNSDAAHDRHDLITASRSFSPLASGSHSGSDPQILHEDSQDDVLAEAFGELALDVAQELISSSSKGKRIMDRFRPDKITQKGERYIIVSFQLAHPYLANMPPQDKVELKDTYTVTQIYRKRVKMSASYLKRLTTARVFRKRAEELYNVAIRLSNKAKVAPILAEMAIDFPISDIHQTSDARTCDVAGVENPFRDPSIFGVESVELTATASIISRSTLEREFPAGSIPEISNGDRSQGPVTV